MVELNLWYRKTGEIPRKTYPDPVSFARKPTWIDRDPNGILAVGDELVLVIGGGAPTNESDLLVTSLPPV